MDASLKIEHVEDLNTRNFRGPIENARSTVTSLTSAGSVVGLVDKNSPPCTATKSPAPLMEQELHKSKTLANPKPTQDIAHYTAKKNNFMKRQPTAEEIIDEVL